MKLVTLHNIVAVAIAASVSSVAFGAVVQAAPQVSNELAYGQTYWQGRPQHSNMARYQLGDAARLHHAGKDEFNGQLSLALEYSQSRNSVELGKWFSVKANSASMAYGTTGSSIDINGLNFGVNNTGTLTFDPRVRNFVAEINLHLDWAEFVEGLWTAIRVPVNYVKTELRATDSKSSEGSTIASDRVESGTINKRYDSLLPAWESTDSFGDIVARTHGIIRSSNSDTTVAGITVQVGYDFLRREHGHLSAALHVVAPSGTEPQAKYLFEAISGASNSWEVGGAVSGRYHFWENHDGQRHLHLLVDGSASYLGRRDQTRIMGLKGLANNVGSSWLLLKEFTSSTGTAYNGKLVPAANRLALRSKIGGMVSADAAASLKYNHDNFGFQVGYNVFYRGAEEGERSGKLEGNYGIHNFDVNDANVIKKSNADIGMSVADATSLEVAGSNDTLLSDSDIDEKPSLQPSALSHKVFGGVEYNWPDNEWEPYVLLGGGYEFAAKSDGVKNSAADQWSVMLKGGIAF